MKLFKENQTLHACKQEENPPIISYITYANSHKNLNITDHERSLILQIFRNLASKEHTEYSFKTNCSKIIS